jgi:hypothetical protein
LPWSGGRAGEESSGGKEGGKSKGQLEKGGERGEMSPGDGDQRKRDGFRAKERRVEAVMDER